MLEIFTPAEKLHSALCRRIPETYVELVRTKSSGLSHVEIFPMATHRWASAPEATRRRAVEWDGDTYRWRGGPDKGRSLPADEDAAADAVAAALGTPHREQPTT